MIEKNLSFKSYFFSNRKMFFLEKFKALQYQLHVSIEVSKEKYYTKLSSSLADLLTSPKTYWSILKTFWNNKKIPCITSLFHENKFIRDFNLNKTHGHDMLSIWMIKLCGNSICKSISIIFNDCLNMGKFRHERKKANVVATHMKGNKQSLKNYRPLSLLPIYSKIFEQLIHSKMYTIFTEKNLIYPNQSWFRSVDYCVNQLLAISHKIYKSFD